MDIDSPEEKPTTQMKAPEHTTLPSGLTPCREVPSITSNTVIIGLKAHLPNIETPEGTPTTTKISAVSLRVFQGNINSLVKSTTYRSLKRLAPIKLSPKGVPRVLIPDEVFHKGAELYKDFIIGIFMENNYCYQNLGCFIESFLS